MRVTTSHYEISGKSHICSVKTILGDPGADSGGEGKSRRAEKYGTKKSKERRDLCFSGTNQKPERRRLFGTGLVRHCPQRLFSPFFTFLGAIFSRPFRLFLSPTICPWVSEDESKLNQSIICLPEQKIIVAYRPPFYIVIKFSDKMQRALNKN